MVRPVPLVDGLGVIRGTLDILGLPPTALCAVELRSPASMTQDSFNTLNRAYRTELNRLGLLIEGTNPIARTNVCPITAAPASPVIHAFTYVAPRRQAIEPTFVISGSAEAPEGHGPYADHTIAYGDTTSTGLSTKADWVIAEMRRRLFSLGQSWHSCTDINVYTRFHDYAPLTTKVARRIPNHDRIRSWPATPPVRGLEFEMDCRNVIHQNAPQVT